MECKTSDIYADSKVPLRVVTTKADARLALSSLANANPPVIAIDIEHHSAHTCEGFTPLIQASTPQEDFLFDCMRMGVREALSEGLNAVFRAPLPLKVFHGAANDVRWLATDFGVRLGSSFVDTHECAVVLGWRSLSLKALVSRLLRLPMSKEEQSGDWRRRPMTPAMLSYARGDTRRLLPMAMRMLAVVSGIASESEVAKPPLDAASGLDGPASGKGPGPEEPSGKSQRAPEDQEEQEDDDDDDDEEVDAEDADEDADVLDSLDPTLPITRIPSADSADPPSSTLLSALQRSAARAARPVSRRPRTHRLEAGPSHSLFKLQAALLLTETAGTMPGMPAADVCDAALDAFTSPPLPLLGAVAVWRWREQRGVELDENLGEWAITSRAAAQIGNAAASVWAILAAGRADTLKPGREEAPVAARGKAIKLGWLQHRHKALRSLIKPTGRRVTPAAIVEHVTGAIQGIAYGAHAAVEAWRREWWSYTWTTQPDLIKEAARAAAEAVVALVESCRPELLADALDFDPAVVDAAVAGKAEPSPKMERVESTGTEPEERENIELFVRTRLSTACALRMPSLLPPGHALAASGAALFRAARDALISVAGDKSVKEVLAANAGVSDKAVTFERLHKRKAGAAYDAVVAPRAGVGHSAAATVDRGGVARAKSSSASKPLKSKRRWRVVLQDVDGSFLSYTSVAQATRMVRGCDAEWILEISEAQAKTNTALESLEASADGAASAAGEASELSGGGYVEPIVRRLEAAEGHDAASDPMVASGFVEGRCCGCGVRPKGLSNVHVVPGEFFYAIGPAIAAFNRHDRVPLCRACASKFRSRRRAVMQELFDSMCVPKTTADLVRQAESVAGPASWAAAAAATLAQADAEMDVQRDKVKRAGSRTAEMLAAACSADDPSMLGFSPRVEWSLARSVDAAPPPKLASLEEADALLRAPVTTATHAASASAGGAAVAISESATASPDRLHQAMEEVCRPLLLAAVRGTRVQRCIFACKTSGRPSPPRVALCQRWQGPRPAAVQSEHCDEYDWLARLGPAPRYADAGAASAKSASSESDLGASVSSAAEVQARLCEQRGFDASERDDEEGAIACRTLQDPSMIGAALDSVSAAVQEMALDPAWSVYSPARGGKALDLESLCATVDGDVSGTDAAVWWDTRGEGDMPPGAVPLPQTGLQLLSASAGAISRLVRIRVAANALERLQFVDGEGLATLTPKKRARQLKEATAALAGVADVLPGLATATGTSESSSSAAASTASGMGRVGALLVERWGPRAEELLVRLREEEKREIARVVAKVAGAKGPSTQPPLLQALPLAQPRRMAELIRFGPRAARGLERLSDWFKREAPLDCEEETVTGESGLSVAAERRVKGVMRQFRVAFIESVRPTQMPDAWGIDYRAVIPRVQWGRMLKRVQGKGWHTDMGAATMPSKA